MPRPEKALVPVEVGVEQTGVASRLQIHTPDDDRTHLRATGAEFFVDRECPRVEIEFVREA